MSMVAIHPVHRRLAELHFKSTKLGGYAYLTKAEQIELNHCMAVNADLILRLDGLKRIAFHAHLIGDMDWQQEICQKIEELEAKLI